MARVKSTAHRKAANLPRIVHRPRVGGKCPAGTVLLKYPITSFKIPSVNAECDFHPTDTDFNFLPPEVVAFTDALTKQVHQTCRVPVMEGAALIGYIPLPLRCRAAWLHLSYTIVAHAQTWSLWRAEEEAARNDTSKEQAVFMRQNSGAAVAQHMLARLMVVEELVAWNYQESTPGEECVRALNEWKVRWSRDWFFGATYDDACANGQKYLEADPISPQNKAFLEDDWGLDGNDKALLFPPDDLSKWFDGEIEGFEALFKKTLKKQAIAYLSKPDQYVDMQHNDTATLPARWHEGQKPAPRFWSPFMWNWAAKGNDFSTNAMQFLYKALTQNPPYTRFEQVLQDVNALMNVVSKTHDWSDIEEATQQLWMGEMTWREFVNYLMDNYANHLPLGARRTSERKDPDNVFDTFEARLLLEGYVRRHDELEGDQDWDVRDDVLWQALARMTVKKYGEGWEWVISQIISGKNVGDVLKSAGLWWKEHEGGMQEDQSGPELNDARGMNVDERQPPLGETSTGRATNSRTSAPDAGVSFGDNDDGSGPFAPDNGMREDENIHGSDTRISPDENLDPSGSHHDQEGLETLIELSDKLFASFVSHRNVEEYEGQMKAAYPSNCAVHIQEYIDDIKAWRVRNGSPPSEAHRKFQEALALSQSSPPQAPPSATPAPPTGYPTALSNATDVRRAQQVAMDHFEEYLNHRDVAKYEADLKAYYSVEYAALIQEHTDGLRASIEANNVPAPYAGVHKFVQGCKVIAKRLEAELVQHALL